MTDDEIDLLARKELASFLERAPERVNPVFVGRRQYAQHDLDDITEDTAQRVLNIGSLVDLSFEVQRRVLERMFWYYERAPKDQQRFLEPMMKQHVKTLADVHADHIEKAAKSFDTFRRPEIPDVREPELPKAPSLSDKIIKWLKEN